MRCARCDVDLVGIREENPVNVTLVMMHDNNGYGIGENNDEDDDDEIDDDNDDDGDDDDDDGD
eukprot:8534700-Karenia_brevis.AAC.1